MIVDEADAIEVLNGVLTSADPALSDDEIEELGEVIDFLEDLEAAQPDVELEAAGEPFDDRLRQHLDLLGSELRAAHQQYRELREVIEDEAEAQILADVLRCIWGANPQAPVTELSSEQLVERLSNSYGQETVERAVETAGWSMEAIDV